MIELPLGVGIVLDLDDTLYPERSFHDSGFRWIAEQTGLDPDGDEVAAARLALRAREVARWTSSARRRECRWRPCWRGIGPTRRAISLYPDAERFLQRAGASQVPLVLLSDGRSETQRRKIEALWHH